MNDTTAVEPATTRPLLAFSGPQEGILMAEEFAKSGLVPAHFRGKPSDCFVAMVAAEHLGDNPLTVMHNMYIVHGTPAFAAKYRIARANASGIFRGRLNWTEEGEGRDLRVTCFATLAETQERVSYTVSMADAEREGWTRNPKYKTLPSLMLRYRSATFLTRLYCEDVMLGYHTVEEAEDIGMVRTQATPAAIQSKRDADAAAMGLPIDAEVEEVDAESPA